MVYTEKKMAKILPPTLAFQFSFQNPGVPQGQAAVPPESMQAGMVKSLLNQNPMASEMLDRIFGSPE
jgi:hypothetical protein